MNAKRSTKNLQPRQKAIQYGMQSLSDGELLCLLIGSGTEQYPMEEVARQILEKTSQLALLHEMTPQSLMELPGVGLAKASLLCACVELAGRSLKARMYEKEILSPVDAAAWAQAELGSQQQELFAVLYLDTKGKIIGHRILFAGTLDQTIVHPREVFCHACLLHAARLILIHNHPSCDPAPSLQDEDLTRRFIEAGKCMGIPVEDHLIVTKSTFFSFRQAQILFE